MAEPSFPPTAREGDRVTALLKTLPGFPSPQGRSPNPSPRTPPGPTGLAPPQPPRVLRAPAPGRVALQRPGTFRLLRLRWRPLRDRSQPAPHRVPGRGACGLNGARILSASVRSFPLPISYSTAGPGPPVSQLWAPKGAPRTEEVLSKYLLQQ